MEVIPPKKAIIDEQIMSGGVMAPEETIVSDTPSEVRCSLGDQVSSEHNDKTLIIEEISRNQKLKHRYRLSQSSINIGRDYQNDIILSDPHICPQHLSLNYAQGVWTIHDKKSVNGTTLDRQHSKVQSADQQVVHDGDVITLGKSQLRILFKDHIVAETVAFSPFEQLIDFIRNPFSVFTAVATFMLIAAYFTYLNQPTETNISQLFVGAFSKALLFSLWPAGVALLSHLTKNEPRILAQLGICFTFYIVMWLSDFLDNIVSFNTASNSVLSLFIAVLSIGIAFSLFWLNSYIGFHVSARRRLIVAFSITTLLFGGTYLIQYSQKPEFDPHPRYNATVMAPSYLIAPTNDVDSFIEKSNELFDKVNGAIELKN